MSKELEALKLLEIEYSKLDYTIDIDSVDVIDLLRRVLTPPTADEVCKALSEWVKGNIPDIWNYKVYYDKEGFHYYNNCDFEEYLVEYERIDKTITFSVFLPPNLIELVAKYYKGEINHEKRK